MLKNEDVVFFFRFAMLADYYIYWAEKIKKAPSSSNLTMEPIAYNGILESSLVSYGRNIALRRRCKPEECERCSNRFRCIEERFIVRIGEGKDEEVYEEKESSMVTYIVTNIDVPTRRLSDTKQAKNIQRHIKLVISMLTLERNKEFLGFLAEENYSPHPSMVYPIVRTVDCWVNEIHPYSITV
jgi:hypothetical protein